MAISETEARAVAAPSTTSQSSRKGKKAWRKNVDITEVQSGLEDLRTAEIHGGLPAEKTSSELFITDTIGDEAIAKKVQEGKKLLKTQEILALRSAVPGLEGRKRKAEDSNGAVRKKAKDKSYVSHRELQKLRDVADGRVDALTVGDEQATHDPWAEVPEVKDERFNFLEDAKPKREPKTLKHTPAPLTTNGKQPRNVAAPHAGKSYNPLVTDWSSLLEREGEKAVETEARRLELEAAQAEQDARAQAEAARVEAAEQDAWAIDYDSAWESEWDGFQSGNEEVHTQKQKGRKTEKERKKVEARKERERAEKHEKAMKARTKEEQRIQQIAKEVSAKDKARRAHIRPLPIDNAEDSSASDDDTVQLQRNRFGKVAPPQQPLEVVLPEELEESLRRLKPEGDLMMERYRNLVVGGKIEGRKRVGQVKKIKTMRSEKWSYKDWKLR